MSENISISLESGPGSYEIQDDFGKFSQKYYNSPRAIISKAKKTSKIYLSAELNKQNSGLESPGVNTYNPNRDKVLSNSPSTFFGKEERTMSHIKPLLNRSPGPVYNQLSENRHGGISFPRARRNSEVEVLGPSPWDYSPRIISKIPSVIIKATYERNSDKFLTPGPGTYVIKDYHAKGTFVSKVGRDIINHKNQSPGPGKYDVKLPKHTCKVNFGSSKRNLDPRNCTFYLDAKSYEIYRDT